MDSGNSGRLTAALRSLSWKITQNTERQTAYSVSSNKSRPSENHIQNVSDGLFLKVNKYDRNPIPRACQRADFPTVRYAG